MSVIYGSLNVDEKYSKLLEPNLYYPSFFIDGKTFTSKYEDGPAGGIYVHKLSTSATTPGTPGRDFVDEATSDTLIPIVLNNNYQKSKKIYGVQASAVAINLANEQLARATRENAEGMQLSGLACLVKEAGVTASTASLTTANFKKTILADRKAIVEGKGTADVLAMTPATFAMLLEIAGSEYTPESNEYANRNGRIGKWLGFDVYEVPALSAASGSYYNSAGSLVTASFTTCSYIMYNHEALSIVPNFEVARIVDSENFNGSKAQVELNVGFKVTSPEQVLVK